MRTSILAHEQGPNDAQVLTARAILGKILLDWTTAWPDARSLDPGLFPRQERLVFEAMHSLAVKDTPIDPLSVIGELHIQGKLEDAGGWAYVAELTNNIPTSACVSVYANKLREFGEEEAAENIISYANHKMHEPGANKREILSKVCEEADKIVPRLKDWTYCDVERWATEPAPPVAWIFENMLAEGELGLIAAAGGLGKTWLALLLGWSAATGQTLLPAFCPVRPTKTLLLLSEDSADVIWRRFRCIPGFDTHVELWRENFRVVAREAEPLVVKNRDGNPVLTPRWKWLQDHISTHGYRFVILDPLARWHSVDENDAACMTAVVQAFESLTVGGTVLLLHHVRKVSSGSLDSEALRGSTALRDGIRWQANLAPLSDNEARALGVASTRGFVRLDVSKANYIASLPAPVIFKRGEEGILEQVDVAALRTATLVDAIASWLAEHPTTKVNLRALQRFSSGECPGAAELIKDLKAAFGPEVTKKRVTDAIETAIRNGAAVIKQGAAGDRELASPLRKVDDICVSLAPPPP